MNNVIVVEVTDENCKEILIRKQNGENICPKCVKAAFDKVKNVFKVPNG